MIETILEPIYTTQKQLDQQAQHNLQEYVEGTHKRVQDMAEKYGFTVQYGIRKGGHESVYPLPSSEKAQSLLVEA